MAEEALMSELVVIGYDSPQITHEALKTVQRMPGGTIAELTGAAVVSVDDSGETHVDTPRRTDKIALSATSGALWAMIIGLLVAMPALGVVGAAVGGLYGKLRAMGIDDSFRGQVRSLLEPGSAAVVIMASGIGDEEFATSMRQHGGTVLKTTLDEATERELAEQLAGSA
ncbi:DUF1269 domain-containing protein [Streptomyces sp. SCSIO 30461]|uniref:DUF1269 domain-containing protein n=1 Tax=Streptomyces sp. SCSIO 30461 TaxID=3118085 RepID=UPI0030CC8327